MDDGVYVFEGNPSVSGERTYVHHVASDVFEDVFNCLHENGAFICTDADDNAFRLSPGTRSKCTEANGCLLDLNISYGLAWRESGEESCVKSGYQTLDAPYF